MSHAKIKFNVAQTQTSNNNREFQSQHNNQSKKNRITSLQNQEQMSITPNPKNI